MAQKSQAKPDLLQKPLYIFDLPEELLLSLTLKSNQVTTAGLETVKVDSEVTSAQYVF